MQENYEAALKALYYKAHVNRNPKISYEALFRRFLNGLDDDRVRFEVKYHKDLADIGETVSQAINHMNPEKKNLHAYELTAGGRARKENVHFFSVSTAKRVILILV